MSCGSLRSGLKIPNYTFFLPLVDLFHVNLNKHTFRSMHYSVLGQSSQIPAIFRSLSVTAIRLLFTLGLLLRQKHRKTPSAKFRFPHRHTLLLYVHFRVWFLYFFTVKRARACIAAWFSRSGFLFSLALLPSYAVTVDLFISPNGFLKKKNCHFYSVDENIYWGFSPRRETCPMKRDRHFFSKDYFLFLYFILI